MHPSNRLTLIHLSIVLMLRKHLPCARQVLGYMMRMQSWVRSFCPYNLKTYRQLRSENTLYKADFLWFLSLIQLLWVFREIFHCLLAWFSGLGYILPGIVWSTWIIFFGPLVETASPLFPLREEVASCTVFQGWMARDLVQGKAIITTFFKTVAFGPATLLWNHDSQTFLFFPTYLAGDYPRHRIFFVAYIFHLSLSCMKAHICCPFTRPPKMVLELAFYKQKILVTIVKFKNFTGDSTPPLSYS